jgi:hypothetical protein
MKLSLLFKLLLFLLSVSMVYGQDHQQNVMDPPEKADSIKHRHSPGLGKLIFAEAFFVGTSYYAAQPEAHGDQVMGWFYASASAAMLVSIPFYLAGKKMDGETKKDRAVNSIIMLGLSYGLSRVATYNLLHADGDASSTRFTRNLIEIHATYLVPLGIALLVDSLLHKKKNKSNVETSLMFDGRTLTFAMRF